MDSLLIEGCINHPRNERLIALHPRWFHYFDKKKGKRLKVQPAMALASMIESFALKNEEGVPCFYKASVMDAVFILTPENIRKWTEWLSESASTTRRWFQILESFEIIEAVNSSEYSAIATRDYLLSLKKPQSLSIGSSSCEWCRCKTLVLHEHHFPIRKVNGGAKTVSICPNCHYEWHALDNATKYRLTPVFAEMSKGLLKEVAS